MKIKLLPENLVTKIAAGEVVERPASVVKELLENSLDAQASFITLEIEKAGLKRITIIDNGIGMEREDLEMCFLPHTTSKISEEDDLFNITSLGFRGEALSSIAAVSELTIKSLPAQNGSSTPTMGVELPFGTEVRIINRKIEEIHSCGMAPGTEITVENLFYNTPARKKFLKTRLTELGQIVNLVTKVALSFPAVGFKLVSDKKTVLELPANQTAEERLKIILGAKIASQLIALKKNTSSLKIAGFIGHPQIASTVKNKQFIFVNNRLIKNTAMSLAIKEAYGSLLEARVHPVFILFLEIAAQNIDVNIHPRKEEIKFLDLASINKDITEHIQEILAKNNLTYRFDFQEVPLYDSYDLSEQGLVLRDEPREDKYTASFLKEAVDLWQVRENNEEDTILQVNNLYLITKTPRGILIVDQHAAHEKILYEQLLEAFEKNKQIVHPLPRSIVFSLPPAEVPFLEEKLETFRKIGFDIEPFGNNAFKVSSVPEIFRQRDIANLIMEVLADLKQDKKASSTDFQTQKIISYLSCRMAIKAGDYLKEEERQKLLEKLAQTKSGYTCPHGRPIQIEVSLNDLDRLFRRK